MLVVAFQRTVMPSPSRTAVTCGGSGLVTTYAASPHPDTFPATSIAQTRYSHVPAFGAGNRYEVAFVLATNVPSTKTISYVSMGNADSTVGHDMTISVLSIVMTGLGG